MVRETNMANQRGTDMGVNKIITAALLGFWLLYLSLFQVTQGHEALLMRFGKITLDAEGQPRVYGPGLHMKIPFINQVMFFDVRLQTMSSDDRMDAARILTKKQKYVLVDYYVKWRIENIALYYQRTDGDARKAEILLRQSIDDALRAAFGERDMSQVIAGQRSDIMDITRKSVEKNAEYLGIYVKDVRVKRVDLPREVSESVYARMRADREKIATMHRSNGQREAEKIRAKADADVTVILASARAEADRIRSQGQAKAAAIYASAYQKDTGFYRFMRSLDAYQATFSKRQDMMVLSTGSAFFRYFNKLNAS